MIYKSNLGAWIRRWLTPREGPAQNQLSIDGLRTRLNRAQVGRDESSASSDERALISCIRKKELQERTSTSRRSWPARPLCGRLDL